MKKHLLVLLAFPLTTYAQSDQSNTFIDLGIIDNDFGTGFEIAGSYDIEQIEPLSIVGSYAQTSDSDFDFSHFSIGASWKFNFDHAVAEQLTTLFHAQIETIKVSGTDQYCIYPEFGAAICETAHLNEKDTGLHGGMFVGWNATESLELFTDISLRTTRDFNLPVTLGARYSFTDNWLVNTHYEFGNYSHFNLSARYQF